MTSAAHPAHAFGAPDERTSVLAANLASVRARLADACRAAGRDPDQVGLVVVTKTYPAADVLRLASLGVIEVGENRDQEAAPKAAEVADAGVELRWHFIGQLQRNKCRSVVQYAAMVQSIDGVRLANTLSRAAIDHGRRLDVLVQVSLDADPTRGGAVAAATPGIGVGASPPGDLVDRDQLLEEVLAAVASADGLALRGLMAVAPLGWEPDRAFASLADIAERVRSDYPGATILSAGMSGDVEQAIRHGATLVRMGSAVLGTRAPVM